MAKIDCKSNPRSSPNSRIIELELTWCNPLRRQITINDEDLIRAGFKKDRPVHLSVLNGCIILMPYVADIGCNDQAYAAVAA